MDGDVNIGGRFASDAARTAPPKPGTLALKLALAWALAGTLALGAAQPLATLLALLHAFLTVLGGLSLAAALIRREGLNGTYSHWHEAAVLLLAGLLGHVALASLS